MIDWSQYSRYFKEEDFADPKVKNSGSMIDFNLFRLMIDLKIRSGEEVKTHSSIGGCVDVNGDYGHSKESFHLMKMGCKAVDFHFECNLNIREQVHKVVVIGFTGVGIYYNKEFNGRILPVSFHVDNRPTKKMQIWKKTNGRYIYLLK